jgi:hypothetical protein
MAGHNERDALGQVLDIFYVETRLKVPIVGFKGHISGEIEKAAPRHHGDPWRRVPG